MVHKIKYFEVDESSGGIYLQDLVNEFLEKKGDNIISIHPLLGKILIVHYTEDQHIK